MPASAWRALAPAKVNLALHVTGRRADGYHLLDTIAVFADVGDRIEIAPADALSLSVTGRFAAHAPGDEQRSRLARGGGVLRAHAGFAGGAAIRVEKNIPAGAGLGGGSADAAAVLLGAERALRARACRPTSSRAIGLKLGADVPMCLAGRALRARGIGEEIERSKAGRRCRWCWSGRAGAVSTAEVFSALDTPRQSAACRRCRAARPSEDRRMARRCRNDLEAPALAHRAGDRRGARSASRDAKAACSPACPAPAPPASGSTPSSRGGRRGRRGDQAGAAGLVDRGDA